MKKLFPIAMVAALALTFTSCKKDYTCECSVTAGGTTTVVGTVTYKDTKSKAKDKCEATSSFGGVTATCKIK